MKLRRFVVFVVLALVLAMPAAAQKPGAGAKAVKQIRTEAKAVSKAEGKAKKENRSGAKAKSKGLSKQCKAITQKGERCKMECVEGSEYCRVHSKSNPNAAKCKAITKDGKRCSRPATHGGYCKQHAKR